MRLALLALFTLALAAGCEETQQFDGQCRADSECPVGAYCRPDNLCACRSDEACEEGEFCNKQGICQTRQGCRSNTDCAAAEFCDLGSGNCLSRTACGSDVHCVHGTYCLPGSNTCMPGCYGDGDCPLYSVCQKAAGQQIGTCLAGRCGDKTFCPLGQRCVNESCVPAGDPNHCAACNNTGNDCGSPSNFCLINVDYDPGNPASGSQYFCGVECQTQDDCPNGYGCGGVQLLTQDLCTDSSQCGGQGRQCLIGEGETRGACTCASDDDCTIDQIPSGCAGSCGGFGLQECDRNDQCLSNNCVKQCQGTGTMCTTDDQCPPLPLCGDYLGTGRNVCANAPATPCTSSDQCLCSSGRCFGTGRPCSTGAECRLTCQDGACLLGAACAPQQGLTCEDLP